jgi:hypothetical protein
MSDALAAFLEQELAQVPPSPIAAMAGHLAGQHGAVAVLFYGSVLRTNDLTGMLDFYVLTGAPHRRGLRGAVERRLWPEISFREFQHDGVTLRAKVATMPLAMFGDAASGLLRDTTIWTRFVQPSLCAWAAEGELPRVVEAIASAAVTASRYAALLGPASGTAEDYWRTLFAATYRTEFRVEPAGRGDQIVSFDRERYAHLLPLAWQAGGIGFTEGGGTLSPSLGTADRAKLASSWRRSHRWGRPLNIARVTKAVLGTEGAVRYGAWKIARHNKITLTPWQARHPLLSSPVILWRLWRRRRQAETA